MFRTFLLVSFCAVSACSSTTTNSGSADAAGPSDGSSGKGGNGGSDGSADGGTAAGGTGAAGAGASTGLDGAPSDGCSEACTDDQTCVANSCSASTGLSCDASCPSGMAIIQQLSAANCNIACAPLTICAVVARVTNQGYDITACDAGSHVAQMVDECGTQKRYYVCVLDSA